LKRYYVLGEERIELEELENLMAIRLHSKMLPTEIGSAFGEIANSEAIRETAAWETCSLADWILVRPNARVAEALDTRSSLEGAASIQRIFLDPNGRFYLGSHRLTVRLRAGVERRNALALLDSLGLEVVHELRFAPGLFQVRLRPGSDFLDLALSLASHPQFRYAEPHFLEYISPRFVPTDPEFWRQWHLKNTGQTGNHGPGDVGVVGADIGAEQAWDTTRGSGIRVAIVDLGFDLTHPDLADAVDPHSGFFQVDLKGKEEFSRDFANYPLRNADHGTFCAGMALARVNDKGGCGIANESGFIAVACMPDQVGSQTTLARAIAYSADPSCEMPGANPQEGAHVISCSLGSPGQGWTMTQVLKDAIDFAVTSGRGGLGVPIFWAVQNGAVDIALDQVNSYEHVIAVGSSTRQDKCGVCASGPKLDFLATGMDVYNTITNGRYGEYGGTSFAAPTAAGVAALVLAAHPTLTWRQVRDILRATCDKIGGVVYDANGHNDQYGFGRVNAFKAVQQALA
jgi:subtilisin family serine protease